MEQRVLVTVYKTGGDFNERDVRKLWGNAKRHCITDMICLTDDHTVKGGFDIIPLKHDLPGWWSKMEMFDLPDDTQYLYLDLDTIVTRSLRPIFEKPQGFAGLRNFNPNKWDTGFASGVMTWKGDYSYLLTKFMKRKEAYIREYTTEAKWGDQQFIQDHLKIKPTYIPDVYGELFATSYKYNNDEEKQQSSIVCFHGWPRPAQVNYDWRTYGKKLI